MTGGNNGGMIFSIVGTGFPLSTNQISITICNRSATIISVTNTQVDFVVPACPNIIFRTNITNSTNTTNNTIISVNRTITVTINSVSDTSLNFTYTNGSLTAPLITSVSPTSANPGVKGIIEING